MHYIMQAKYKEACNTTKSTHASIANWQHVLNMKKSICKSNQLLSSTQEIIW